MKNKYLVTVLGPTAIGKTALSVRLAEFFQTEILSSDSRQFYKEMAVGTAVPTKEERGTVAHHFIQNRSIFESYNVGQFEKDAIDTLHRLFQDHAIVVMVGGSGLYVDAVLKGLDNFPEIEASVRQNLKDRLATEGIRSLQAQLKVLDPETYQKIDLENPQRLIRALEVCLGTGKPYASFLSLKHENRDFIPIKIGLTAERSILYDRINKRVDNMVAQGLVNEAEKLHPHKHLNALQTVGYKELFAYFEGEYSLEFAIEEIKKNTRRFAKRQGTWFRKDPEIKWFDYQSDTDEIIAYIKQITNE